MKILYITTIGGTMDFFTDLIFELIREGNLVDIATNETLSPVNICYREWGCRVHPISCTRSPFHPGSLKAIQEIRTIVAENHYDVVHCHTPIAAMCTRLACRPLRKKGVKVIYTAHGFHFYKGAPLKNWLLYYPMEKLCSYFTDLLITINREDYVLAQKKLKAKRVEYVPGVGIDVDKFRDVIVDRAMKRREIGIPEDAVLLLSVGELNHNKNHEMVIRAIAEMEVYYVIAGRGNLQKYLQELIDDLGITHRVKLLGFRTDIAELCKTADMLVFPSIREGLPVSLMEAMACGMPIACTRIRGNVDLIDENGGILFDSSSIEACRAAIEKIMQTDMQEKGQYNLMKVKAFSKEKVIDTMKNCY